MNRSRNVLTDSSKGVLLLWIFFVRFTMASVTSVSCCRMALLYVVFYYAFVILPYCVLRHVWYLIVLISEICLGSAEFRQNAECGFKTLQALLKKCGIEDQENKAFSPSTSMFFLEVLFNTVTMIELTLNTYIIS